MTTILILLTIIFFVIISIVIVSYEPPSMQREIEETKKELEELEKIVDGYAPLPEPTYDQVDIGCSIIIEDIKKRGIKIDEVIGVLRGGQYPAEKIATALNVPLILIKYSSKEGAGDDKNHDNLLPAVSGKKLLIVDDIADTGRTMEEIFGHYTRAKHTVFTAVLYYKNHEHKFVPDFFWKVISEESEWIIFPWEKERDV